MAVIALVGTPRAWQEVSNLLAAAQHKAQVKFWSMVLEPGEREAGATELVAAAQPFAAQPAVPASDCPLNNTEPQEKQASNKSGASNSRTDSARLQPRQKAQQPAASAPASHGGLMATAPRALTEGGSAEHTYYFKGVPAVPPPSIAKGPLTPPAVIGAVPPEALASRGDSYRMVMIPITDPAAMALFEKENIVQWKLLKKSEESKTSRQRGRLPVGRATVVTTVPAS